MTEDLDNDMDQPEEVTVTAHGFAALGLNQVAYIRDVIKEGKPGFAIHGADGTFLTIVPSREAAEGVIISNELVPVSLH